MIITNTSNGQDAFLAVKEETVSKEFPVQYGVDSNYCLTNTTKKPKQSDKIIEKIASEGYESVAEKYFGCGIPQKAYWLIPPKMRKLIRKMRGH